MLGERKNERERHVWYIMEPIYPLFRRRKLGGLFSLKASLSHEIHYKSTWSSQNLWFHKKSQNSKSGPIRGNDSQIIFHIVFQFVYCYDFPTNCSMYYRNLSFWSLTSFDLILRGLCWFVLVCVSLCWFVCFITTPCGQCYQQKSHKKPSLGTVLYKFFMDLSKKYQSTVGGFAGTFGGVKQWLYFPKTEHLYFSWHFCFWCLMWPKMLLCSHVFLNKLTIHCVCWEYFCVKTQDSRAAFTAGN